MAIKPGEDGTHITFCRICEAFCGMMATVENGRVVKLTPDRDNPHSQGHVCIKGVTFDQVVHDPDRVTRPLKRIGGPGEFSPVSWDEALDDIAHRLSVIIKDHGPDAVASYKGNPIAFSTDASIGLINFLDALKIRKYYGAGSQDTNARFAANFILFGSAVTFELPDIPNCDFLIVMGANPLVSNGSLLNSPRIRHDLDAVANRGRVIVVDPRCTETARRYEYLPIRPNGDAWLLMGMLRTLLLEGLADTEFLAEHTIGWSELRSEVLRLDMDRAAVESGISGEVIAKLARDFARTPRAAIYGRLGICRGPFATLENFLLSALNIVGGKFGRPGGANFPRRLLAGSEKGAPGGYGETHTRIGAFPSVARFLASAVMPADMTEPGPGRVRALIATGGNVLLAAPGGATLEKALSSLELMISLDFYQNESNRYAHYILPSPTFLERDDVPLAAFSMLVRPFIQYTDAVLEPVGLARSEYDVFQDLLARMGRNWFTAETERPMDGVDRALRMGAIGDGGGVRDGWSFHRLRDHPHGVMVDLADPYDDWERVAYPDQRLRLWHELIAEEFSRFRAIGSQQAGLKLVTRRDLRSMNSWLHNVDRLVRSQHPALLMNPTDADEHGLATGDLARLWNEHGDVLVVIEVTDEMMPKSVCYPHGWGHSGGWRIANRQAGSNINQLLGIGPGVVERVSGTTIMDGIDVRVEKVHPDLSCRATAGPDEVKA